jgi:predicted ATPase
VVSVERPVTIAVAGTHSTGKSTFLARLAHALRREGVEVATVADLAEQAHRTGLPILHAHNYTSTLWIMTRGISEELATWPHADVLLVDRPIPDALGYYLAALAYRDEEPDPAAIDHLSTLAHHHSIHYDLVLRTVLDDKIPIGAGRDRNHRYRRLADHHVERVLCQLSIGHELLNANQHDTTLERVADFALERLRRTSVIGR